MAIKSILLYLSIILLFPNFTAAQKKIRAKPVRNIILMIGDGMGTAQIYAGLTGNKGHLQLERCTYAGFQKTQSSDNYITDSGAGATAFSIGQKTKNGSIGVDSLGKSQPTILEIAKENALGTGIVVTCTITHATPASFYAHQQSRSQEEDIAMDLARGNVDVFIGGGKKFFSNRKDGKDLIKVLREKNYSIADSADNLSRFTAPKLAAFTSYDQPPKISEGRGDQLLTSTQHAIRLLDQNKKGFFLMVEGSQIDWGGHANDTQYAINEMIDFDKAIGVALDFARKDGNTLVIITADHETGGMAITGGDLANGKVQANFITKGHTGVMVPVFAYGPGAEVFSGIYENKDIFYKMLKALAIHGKVK